MYHLPRQSKPREEQFFIGPVIDYFVDTVTANIYPPNDYLKKSEEIKNKTQQEKERYVTENIDKMPAYINNECKFVFIHMGPLEDRELVVE